MPRRLSVTDRIERNTEERNSPRGRIMQLFRDDGDVNFGKVTLKPDHVELTFASAVFDSRDVSSRENTGTAEQANNAFEKAKFLLRELKVPFEEATDTKPVTRRREPDAREETIASYRAGDKFVQDYETQKTTRTVRFNYQDIEPLLPRDQGKSAAI